MKHNTKLMLWILASIGVALGLVMRIHELVLFAMLMVGLRVLYSLELALTMLHQALQNVTIRALMGQLKASLDAQKAEAGG
jgi:uncharacterized membrane protein YhiD involved in acid resistance